MDKAVVVVADGEMEKWGSYGNCRCGNAKEMYRRGVDTRKLLRREREGYNIFYLL